jgi:drug/metabolite transporter (DMT)-like permease
MNSLVAAGQAALDSIESTFGRPKAAFLLSAINSTIFFSTYILISHTGMSTGLAFILRGSLSLALLLAISTTQNLTLSVHSADTLPMYKRSILLTLNQVMLVESGKWLPPSTAITVNTMGPILVHLVDWGLYGKRIGGRTVLAAGVSFFGVFLIVNRDAGKGGASGSPLALALLLLSQVGWAVGVLQVRFLSQKVSSISVSFYYAIFILFFGVLFYSN